MELALDVNGLVRSAEGGSVSILVFVELALDARSRPASVNQIWVSILVFVELALDAPVFGVARHVRAGFNPCFRGTCS